MKLGVFIALHISFSRLGAVLCTDFRCCLSLMLPQSDVVRSLVQKSVPLGCR